MKIPRLNKPIFGRIEFTDDKCKVCGWKGTLGPCFPAGYFESCKICWIYMPRSLPRNWFIKSRETRHFSYSQFK